MDAQVPLPNPLPQVIVSWHNGEHLAEYHGSASRFHIVRLIEKDEFITVHESQMSPVANSETQTKQQKGKQ